MGEAAELFKFFQTVLASGGAAGIAGLSLMLNIYLWRALRVCERSWIDFNAKEIERMRAEITQMRTAKESALERLDMMARMVTDRTAPRRRGGQDDDQM